MTTEHKIGEIIKSNGLKIQIVEATKDIKSYIFCDCYFDRFDGEACLGAKCSGSVRKDGKDITYKVIEETG